MDNSKKKNNFFFLVFVNNFSFFNNSADVLRLRIESKEKYIVQIAKKWIELKEKLLNGSYEECQQIYHELQNSLIQCDSVLSKSEFYDEFYKLENEKFEKSIVDKNEEIESLKKEITMMKKEYEQLNVEKKNREQYEMLVKLINEYPSKEKTENDIQAIEKEISQLEEENDNLDESLVNHSKQFQLLFFSLQQLDQEISEENKKPSEKSNDMDLSNN